MLELAFHCVRGPSLKVLLYRWVEHTSELELEIEADSLAGVFDDAATAFGEVFVDAPRHHELEREVSVSAEDLPGLLAEWLGELAYLAETDGFIPERVVRIELAGTAIEALVAGHLSEPQSLVKGATYHRLALASDQGRWRARAVLDV